MTGPSTLQRRPRRASADAGKGTAAFVIMAGGRGERLWPLTRGGTPKVCLKPDGRRSLLAMTLSRLNGLARPSSVTIVAAGEQAGAIRRAVPSAYRQRLLLEPEPKNTAACLALAAGMIAASDPDRLVAALPADHRIEDGDGFRRSLDAALRVAASRERIVLIGIRPNRPHPGLGHLRLGPAIGSEQGCRVFPVAEFVEKPDADQARRLAADASVLWNSGIFVGRAGRFVALIERWLPELAARLAPIWARQDPANGSRLAAAYAALDPVSFDHGIMARVTDGLAVEGAFDWDDLGSLDAWAAACGRPAEAVLSIEGRNVRVVAEQGRLIATVGVEDLVIVQDGDATVVCRAGESQLVRAVVERLSRDARWAKYL